MNRLVRDSSDHLVRHSPLILAAASDRDEAVQLLLKSGADVNLVTNGQTALLAASALGSDRSVQVRSSIHHSHCESVTEAAGRGS